MFEAQTKHLGAKIADKIAQVVNAKLELWKNKALRNSQKQRTSRKTGQTAQKQSIQGGTKNCARKRTRKQSTEKHTYNFRAIRQQQQSRRKQSIQKLASGLAQYEQRFANKALAQ